GPGLDGGALAGDAVGAPSAGEVPEADLVGVAGRPPLGAGRRVEAVVVAADRGVAREVDALLRRQRRRRQHVDRLLDDLGGDAPEGRAFAAGAGDDEDREAGRGLDGRVLVGVIAVDDGPGGVGLVAHGEGAVRLAQRRVVEPVPGRLT